MKYSIVQVVINGLSKGNGVLWKYESKIKIDKNPLIVHLMIYFE